MVTAMRKSGARQTGVLETSAAAGMAGLQVYALRVMRTGRPLRAFQLTRAAARKQRSTAAAGGGPKTVRCGRRYYRDVYVPGWPSRAFNTFAANELEYACTAPAAPAVSVAMLKVTRRCPLRCEHCVDGTVHDGAEDPPRTALLQAVRTLREEGVTQLQITGGEPLTRLTDVLALIRSTEGRLDVRLQTSGIGLTANVARGLKEVGLIGVHLSLDHWDPERHDAFRGGTNVYEWVARAASHVHAAGLLLVLSLCPTRDFVTRENLERYADTAKVLGAAFVQIVEPRSVGCYAGRNVALTPAQVELLESFVASANASPRRSRVPVFVHPDGRQRRHGCYGGIRYIYVDERGRVYRCPFDASTGGTLGERPIADMMERLRRVPCSDCPLAPHPPGCGEQGSV